MPDFAWRASEAAKLVGPRQYGQPTGSDGEGEVPGAGLRCVAALAFANHPRHRRCFVSQYQRSILEEEMATSKEPNAVAAGTASPRCIDVHHHFLPPAYLSAVGEAKVAASAAAGRLSRWSVERSLELMELGGIETTIASSPSPGSPIGDIEDMARLCRTCNDVAGQIVRDHPGRFGMFAAVHLLPGLDIDRALGEIAYCLDVLGADGVGLRSSYLGRHLGDPSFDPLWEELNRRGCVVHVHPGISPAEGVPGVTASMLEYPFDTTRAIVSLLFNGIPARFPRVTFIFSHAGGAIPYLAGRVATFSDTNPNFKQRGLTGAIPALQNFYYDITDSANPYTFKALRELVPVSHLLFGSDIPFAEGRLERMTRSLAELGLEQQELQAINRNNALALFPRFQAIRRSRT
jgi:6-methylsalicylate decarboxylase